MMISTKGRYALRILVDIAIYTDTDIAKDGYVPLGEVAARQEISMKYLEAIIATLAKEGIVESKRGKSGGYKLAMPPEECTVGAVVKAAEGGLSPVACPECDGSSCARAADCKTVTLWRNLDTMIDRYLETVTIRDLLENRVEPIL